MRQKKVEVSPKKIEVVEIESFYKQEADGIYYYWRPLFENKEYSWYSKLTPFKEMPYVEFVFDEVYEEKNIEYSEDGVPQKKEKDIQVTEEELLK